MAFPEKTTAIPGANSLGSRSFVILRIIRSMQNAPRREIIKNTSLFSTAKTEAGKENSSRKKAYADSKHKHGKDVDGVIKGTAVEKPGQAYANCCKNSSD